jgi:hypothetical protein
MYMLQNLSNGVLGAQFGACLPFQPRFWTFTTPVRMQLPKWECTWEPLGSIPCTLPHLWECVSHPNTFFWSHGPLHSTLSCEPNDRVVTFLFLLHLSWGEIKFNGFSPFCLTKEDLEPKPHRINTRQWQGVEILQILHDMVKLASTGQVVFINLSFCVSYVYFFDLCWVIVCTCLLYYFIGCFGVEGGYVACQLLLLV